MIAVAKVGTLPQTVRRDFSTIDYGEAMRRAREIVPEIVNGVVHGLHVLSTPWTTRMVHPQTTEFAELH